MHEKDEHGSEITSQWKGVQYQVEYVFVVI